MIYTKKQITFWSILGIFLVVMTWLWFELFNEVVKLGLDIFMMVVINTAELAVFNFWGVRIVRSKDFKSKRFLGRAYPSEVDCWNTVQRGVWGVSLLVGAIPVLSGYILSLFL